MSIQRDLSIPRVRARIYHIHITVCNTSSQRDQKKRRSPGRKELHDEKKEGAKRRLLHPSVWIGWTRLVWATITVGIVILVVFFVALFSRRFEVHFFQLLLPQRREKERERERDNLIKGGRYCILLTKPSMTCFLLRVFGCLTSILPAARPWPPVQKCMELHRQNNNKSTLTLTLTLHIVLRYLQGGIFFSYFVEGIHLRNY